MSPRSAMMVGMEEKQIPKRKWSTCAAVILILLVLYPLSIGPAIGLSSRYPYPRLNDIVFTVYAPLIVIVHKTGTGKPVAAYVNWCVGIIDPEGDTEYGF